MTDSTGARTDADNRQPGFLVVQFGDEHTEPVMIPVDDLAILGNESAKQKIIDSAWAYFQRGQFARESLNEGLIEALADDFSGSLEVHNLLTRLVTARLAESYVARLKKEVSERGDSVVDPNARHLGVDVTTGEDRTITINLPDDWETAAIERVGEMTAGMFPKAGREPLSWYKFAEWVWINRIAGALGDLEEEVGERVLAEMSRQSFDKALFARAFHHETSADEMDELIFRRVEHVAEIAAEAIEKTPVELWMIETLLGFRDLPPPGLNGQTSSALVTVDFGKLLRAIAAKPEDMYGLPPRRFEELLAHIFERFGYEVCLTGESRDGGYDISAIRKAETESRVLIECKRYTPPNKVGRPIVQRIMGVLNDRDIRATMAIVATTSTFTADAKAYIEANRWRVAGRDFDGVVDWINTALK